MQKKINQSFLHLQLILKEITHVFLKLFKEKLKLFAINKNKRKDFSTKKTISLFIQELKIKWNAREQKILNECNFEEFDLTILSKLLMNIGKKDSTLEQIIKGVREIRNSIAHNPKLEVTDNEYDSFLKSLCSYYEKLGYSRSDLEKLKLFQIFSEEKISEQFANLKEIGNKHFQNKNFEKAIEAYTEADKIEGLSEKCKAILHSNKANAFFELYMKNKNEEFLDESLKNARMCIYLSPDFLKGYYRIAKIYEEKEKYNKAILYYNKFLALNPANEEINQNISVLKKKEFEAKRGAMLFSDSFPKTNEEHQEDVYKYFENRNTPISKDLLENTMKMSIEDDPSLKDVWKAHEFRDGSITCPQNFEMALVYYSKAAQQGNVEAFYNLGHLYETGKGVKRDIGKALNFFEKAAHSPPIRKKFGNDCPVVGVSQAQHALGLFYSEGIWVDKNLAMGIEYYQKAMENGSSESTNNLGNMYFNENDFIKKDLEKAEKLFLKAFELGNQQAAVNLVDLYLAKNYPEQALLWHERGIKRDCPYSISRNKEIRRTIQSMIDEFEETGIPSWEKNYGLENNNLNQNERMQRFSGINLEPANKFLEGALNFDGELPEKFTGVNLSERKQIEELAKKGSLTAKNIISACDFFIAFLESLNEMRNGKNSFEKMILSFSAALKNEPKICKLNRENLEYLKPIIEKALAENINEKSYLDESTRFCYSHLIFVETEKTKEFLKFCISKYPESKYFYYLQSRILNNLKLFNENLDMLEKELIIHQDSFDLIYLKALCLRNMEKFKESIKAYKFFISKSDQCHNKVPESYYSISFCKFRLNKKKEKIRNYYEKGLESEKNQLSIFLPYESNTKIIIENFFDLFVKAPNFQVKKNKFLDVIRVNMVLDHRKSLKSHKQFMNKYLNFNFQTFQPRKSDIYEKPKDFKEIFLRDIDSTKDHILKGYFLKVTLIDFPNVPLVESQATFFLIEDENGDVQRMAVYKLGTDFSIINDKYPFGCRVKINDPYFRLASDGKPMIRVDNPKSLTLFEYKIKSCRLCGVENCKLLCSICKQVYYCSKECQSLDWKNLHHKYICK